MAAPARREGRPPRGRLLLLKIWRDALSLGATSAALVVLVGVGACLFVAFAEAGANLGNSYRGFYAKHQFADATVLVENAPESLVNTARLLPGVREAVGRTVKDGTIILRDRPRRRIMGRFIGLPAVSQPPVNQVYLVAGRYLSSRHDLLLEQQFARLNDLEVGDLLTASYLGRRRDFRIVGVVASPEYLYPAPSKEASWASPASFGVCWIDEDAARQWFGVGRTITEVHVLCEAGAAPRVLEILRALGDRYGLRSWWDQAEQPSNRLLSMDLQGFLALSVMFPALFMFAAGLSLYSSLTRIVRLQTGIVGFLRASGFTARQVLWHYVLQGGFIAGTGALPGVVIGHGVAVWMVRLYGRQLHLPQVVTDPSPGVIAASLILAVGTGLLAAWIPARSAARTSPAVAMRGDQDEEAFSSRTAWIVRLTSHLPVLFRIPVRGLVRHPSRSLFAVGGLVSGTALLLSTVGMYTSIMSAIDQLMNDVLRYELDVSFVSPQGERLAMAVAQAPGVEAVYRTCVTTVRVRSPHGVQTLLLQGLENGQTATKVPTLDGRRANLRPGEIWLPSKLARTLHVEAGDPVLVEWAFSSRSRNVDSVMRVGGLLAPGIAAQAYGEYDDLCRTFLDRTWPDGGRGAHVVCSPEVGEGLRRQLERDDLVAAVLSIQDIRDEVKSSLRITIIFCSVLLAFGAVLAGAVLHSVSSVGILERLRELATLRSLGFSARATTTIAAVEIWALCALGLLFGLPVGAWLNQAYLGLYETETMSFPVSLPPSGYLVVTLLVCGLVALSLRAGMARLRSMDLAQATKARE